MPTKGSFTTRCPSGHVKGPGRCQACKRIGRSREVVTPESRRASHLKTKWGMTTEDYKRMLDRQDGVCAICHKPPLNNALAIDHDHDTGKIRGLLCSRCNSALGWLETREDSIVAYREEH